MNTNSIINEEDNKSEESKSSSKSSLNEKCEENIKMKKRATKKEKYAQERKEIIEKMNNLLGIDEKKNYVYLYDIENNEEIKKEINKMSEEIKKYFKVGNWNYYIMKNNNEKPLEIGLVRAVYRDEDIIMTTKEKYIERGGKKVRSIIYYLINK
jgi:hypothetical protein